MVNSRHNNQVHFEIKEDDVEDWMKIKQSVLSKFEKLRGVLGKEVVRLAMLGLEYSTHTPKDVKFSKIRNPRIILVMEFLNKYVEKHISQKDFEKWIVKNMGHDPRTKKTYRIAMINMSCLTPDPKSPTRFTINKPRIEALLKRMKK